MGSEEMACCELIENVKEIRWALAYTAVASSRRAGSRDFSSETKGNQLESNSSKLKGGLLDNETKVVILSARKHLVMCNNVKLM